MPILNHSQLSGCRARGQASAMPSRTIASANAQRRREPPKTTGQPATSANTAANTNPNDRSDEPLTSSRSKRSWVSVGAIRRVYTGPQPQGNFGAAGALDVLNTHIP